ncbi:hypothetical protein [Ulvibacter antarcticus]|uniref:Uncharacterized protein n=1 Tax=Ulvibacter antarcticus TaxID=442714 RepID=A0A3L9YIF9_9FLAO|nr:hypothetical protein [Ulvibacter antarcticus]RMA59009.1 hypothetical protein BXY75_2391 [Ulvibacter antarcticus]
MKKIIYLFIATSLFISCSVDNNEMLDKQENLKYELATENSNLGSYKGVFTTNNSEYRAIVDINLPLTQLSKQATSVYPIASITLNTGETFVAKATARVENGLDITNLEFISEDLSFTFVVNADGSNPVVSNVVFRDLESAILIAKHSSRAPITPITGTYVCVACNDHPSLNNTSTQTFNMVFSVPDGVGTVTTQAVLGSTVFNGTGNQDTCVVNGTYTDCNIDGSFTAGGAPITWDAYHLFDNQPSGANDCSSVGGVWHWETFSYGTITGSLVSDNTCLTTLYTEDFQTFTGAGFAPTPTAGQLDSDIIIASGFSGTLTYGGTQTSGDFARGSSAGGVTTGGIYAFDIGSGNIALGVQPGGSDFTPGTFDFKIENTTGMNFTNVIFSSNIYVNNDEDRGNTYSLTYSNDGVTYNTITASEFTTTEVQDALGFQLKFGYFNRTFPITLNAGDFLYLRINGDDALGAGARDEFAFDQIIVQAY